jgi:hypothetical protein
MIDQKQFECSVQLVGLLGGVRNAYYLQESDIKRGDFDMVRRLKTGDKRKELISFIETYAPQLTSVESKIDSIKYYFGYSSREDNVLTSVVVSTLDISDETDMNDDWLKENLSLCGTYNPSDRSNDMYTVNIVAQMYGLKATLITYVYPVFEDETCGPHTEALLAKFRVCMPGLRFFARKTLEHSENSIIKALFNTSIDLRTLPDSEYNEIVDTAINLGYNIGLMTLNNKTLPKDKMTPEKRGMLMYMALQYKNDPMSSKIYQNMLEEDKIEYESRQNVLSDTVNEYFENNKGPSLQGGGAKSRKERKSRSPRRSRLSLFRSRSLKGGWKSVPKSNPELWQKVLNSVKREPGPWAAWKAIKADKIYKEKGGKFLKSREKKSRSSRRKV